MNICPRNQDEKLQHDAHMESQGLQSLSTHWTAGFTFQSSKKKYILTQRFDLKKNSLINSDTL